jgi:hypothetical protein
MNCDEFRVALAADLDFEPARRDEAAAHAAAARRRAPPTRPSCCAATSSSSEVVATAADAGEDEALARRFDRAAARQRRRGEWRTRSARGAAGATPLAHGRWRRRSGASWMAVGAGRRIRHGALDAATACAFVQVVARRAGRRPLRHFLAPSIAFSRAPPSGPTSAAAVEGRRRVRRAGALAGRARVFVDADRLSDESYAYLHALEDRRRRRVARRRQPPRRLPPCARRTDAAIELARESPHLKYGGEIEIRAVARSGGER